MTRIGADDNQRDAIMRQFIAAQPMLGAFLYALCSDWTIVEETLQETAVYICNHWRDFKPGTRFNSWARSVARRRCYETIRRVRGSKKEQGLGEEVIAAIPDALWDTAPAEDGRRAALSRCLEDLQPRQRELLDRHYRRGEDGARLARQCDRSVAAIYMALSRLRKRIRACIEQRLSNGGLES